MKKLAILLSLCAFSMTALAEVKLVAADNIKVTAINGQEIKHGLLQPLQKEFKLNPGRHMITARYDRLFDLPRGEHDYVKSGSITISADLSDNTTYQLVMPNAPKYYKDAKEFAKAPTLNIVNGTQVIASESTAQSQNGIFSALGSKVSGLFGGGSDVADNQKAIAALSQSNTAPVESAPKVSGDKLDGFMELWLNASPEEREKIRQWVQK